MEKKIILILLTGISFFYCFRFGYILTAYGHGGQLAGVPFALVMMTITIILLFTPAERHRYTTYIIGLVYFLTLAAFSITIEAIRDAMPDYFGFLYYEPGGYVNKILLGWCLIGAIAFIFLFRRKKNV